MLVNSSPSMSILTPSRFELLTKDTMLFTNVVLLLANNDCQLPAQAGIPPPAIDTSTLTPAACALFTTYAISEPLTLAPDGPPIHTGLVPLATAPPEFGFKNARLMW